MAQGITNSTKVLLSSIELPEDALLHYSIYTSPLPDSLSALESARRKVSGTAPEGHLLPSPVSRIHLEDGKPVLYVFHLTSVGDDAPTIQLDDLTRITSKDIDIPQAVSSRMLCPENHGPCTCSHSKQTLDQATKDSNLAQSLFLDSVRDCLVDEICAKSTGKGHIPAVRLRNGFCLMDSRKSSEWAEKWAKGVNNGLIFCEIQLHLTATHILVQPIPRRIAILSPLLPTPPGQGAAILLLPYGIPAFYLGSHTADDRTASEFAETISSSGIHQSISKDFAKCYVPFRRINDRQDGGITTIWPRALVLVNTIRPSLTAQASNSSAPTSAVKGVKGNHGEMHPALSLTSLSLHSSPSLDALSTAMGIYVDASMKDRDRPSRQNSTQTRPQPSQPEQAPQASSSTQQAQIDPQPVPESTPEAVQPPPPAQSYPSPLELIHAQPQPVTNNDAAPEPAVTQVSQPAPIPVDDPPPAQPQQAYASQQLPLDSWDFGTGNFGGGGSVNFGFGGGDMGNNMFSDPFSAAMFTDDDFNFLDVPTVQPTTAAALGDTGDGGVGDVMMDFASSNQAQGDATGFEKLETGLLDWNLEFPSVVGDGNVANTSLDDASQLQQIFGVEGLESDLPSSLLGPKTPGLTLDAPSVQIRLDSNSPMNLDRIGSEEIGEEEVPVSEGFLALRFGRDIGLADEKYTSGKYSLPSPPPEDHTPLSRPPLPPTRTNSLLAAWPIAGTSKEAWKSESRPALSRMNSARPPLSRASTTELAGPWKSSTAREGDLRSRYMAATHPSNAMLYKLAGTKRPWEIPLPTTPRASSSRAGEEGKEESVLESPLKKRRLSWTGTGEEWRNPTPPMEESDDDGEDGDSSEGGEDGWNEGMDLIGIDADPATAGPYKSDGPMRFEDPVMLLQAQFDAMWILEHDLVSPTDLILPPPGPSGPSASSIGSRRSSVPPAPVSVPTPVSPEALMGGNDNSSRLTVAVAQQFAHELGKNVMWCAMVGAMRVFAGSALVGKTAGLWQVDVDVVLDALKATKVEWGKSIEDFVEVNEDLPAETPASPEKEERQPSDSEHVQTLQVPKIYLGHGTSVIESLPTIVRFWNQLNVTPLNGSKDIHAVALLSDAGGNAQLLQAEMWLEKLGKEYTNRRFGLHTAAQLQKNPKGVASIRWDNFRSVCDRLVSAAKDTLPLPLIVYVIVPNTFANLSHPSAMHVLNTISDINDSLSNTPGKLLFHLIPEVFVSHSRSLSHNSDFGLDRLALSVYDSVPKIVEREHSRLSSKIYPVRESIDAHAFVLANSRSSKAVFVEKWPPPTASIFDRYSFLHVAYGISTDGEWIAASVVTESGDKQESRIWRVEEDEPLVALVKNVLEFTLKIARRADVEWRVTISKNGTMSASEFDAWTIELAARVEQVEQSMHLTLMSVTSGESPVFISTPQLAQLPAAPLVAARSSGAKDSTVFADSSSATFLVFPKPVGIAVSSIDGLTQADFLASDSGENKSDALSMTPISTCWLVHVLRRADWTQRQHNALSAINSSTSGCQLHALHFVRFGNSSYAGETEEHMRNIAKSFYDLIILNEMRRGTFAGAGTFRQPLHIALVEGMTAALGGLSI